MTNLLGSWFSWIKVDLGEGAFYAAFGFVFVFLGILLLVAFFTLLGLVMKKINERKQRKEEAAIPKIPAPASAAEEGIPPEVVAAITAAIAVYTAGERQKCDFVVRKIRRI